MCACVVVVFADTVAIVVLMYPGVQCCAATVFRLTQRAAAGCCRAV